MKSATPQEFWLKFGDFKRKVYFRVAGTFQANASIKSYDLESLLKFQTLNQPMIIYYEENDIEVFIISIDIQKFKS